MGKLFLNKKKIQLSNQQDNSIQESIENLSKSDISETFDTEQELKQFRQKSFLMLYTIIINKIIDLEKLIIIYKKTKKIKLIKQNTIIFM